MIFNEESYNYINICDKIHSKFGIYGTHTLKFKYKSILEKDKTIIRKISLLNELIFTTITCYSKNNIFAELMDKFTTTLNYLLFTFNLNYLKNKKLFVFFNLHSYFNLHKKILILFIDNSNNQLFISSLSNNRRHFTPSLYLDTAKNLLKLDLISENYYKLIEISNRDIEEIKTDDDDDIPDEFLDPLNSMLIQNPVVLPASKIIIDKNSILRWLFSKKEDPFSRKELTEEILKKYNETKEAKNIINEFNKKLNDFKIKYKNDNENDNDNDNENNNDNDNDNENDNETDNESDNESNEGL